MTSFPLITDPPYHRPIAEHEIPLIVEPGAPPTSLADLAIGPGWTLSFFSTLSDTGERLADFGWTKGDFAITATPVDDRSGHVAAELCYLPFGAAMGYFEEAVDAIRYATLLAREIDWPSIGSFEALLARKCETRALLAAHFYPATIIDDIGIWRAKPDEPLARAHG